MSFYVEKKEKEKDKNLKIWVESREGKNIVIAVQRTVSYTAHSSTTDGNVRLAVALCVCVLWKAATAGGLGGSLSLIPATRITTAS